YWRTTALDDGFDDDNFHANYYDLGTTNQNAAARFKDGDYDIHVVLSDISGKVNDIFNTFRVANFPRNPVMDAGAGAAGPPIGGTTPRYDTTVVEEFSPD